MKKNNQLIPIAKIQTVFPEKFGIPRQSGLTEAKARITFELEYRVKEAFRGLEEYSHIWVLWGFSGIGDRKWSPTVRPPRLGGNTRMGVFATRSPFRPNPIGLSCLELVGIDWDSKEAPVLIVKGADMMDGTPIYDIKPYLTYVDSYPNARAGFAGKVEEYRLHIVYEERCEERLNSEEKKVLTQILEQDPRPAYQNDPERIYGMGYAGYEVKFRVDKNNIIVTDIV